MYEDLAQKRHPQIYEEYPIDHSPITYRFMAMCRLQHTLISYKHN